MKRLVALGLIGASLFISGAAVSASDYPNRMVRVVVPVTPGGPSDVVARYLGDRLSAVLGKPVVVENRSGASHIIGTDLVAKSAPDGYTLLQAASNMALNPIIQESLPYDTLKDFAPISFTHLTPLVVVVSGESPLKSMDDLIRFAKKNPAEVSYATTGQGSPQQLAMQLLAQKTGIGKMVEVPYKGSSPAHPDLISQRVTVMIDPAAAVFGHIQSGALRALAVTTAKRIDGLPDVPTVGESSVPGYEVSSWGGMFAPAGTPPDVISRLNGELEKILSTADVKSRFAGLGLVAKHSSADELSQFLKSEITQWRTVMTAGSK